MSAARTRRPLVSLLALLAAASLAAGSPALSRPRRSSFETLAGGIPLQALFAFCQVSSENDNIGPCLAELLRGAIDKARPNFQTGLDIAREHIVLEPLKLDDIEPKEGKSVQTSVRDLKVHGISTLSINDITFSSDELALNLSFANVTATGLAKISYLFLSASPRVQLELSNLTVLVRANWMLDINPDDPEQLDIVLHNATAKFKLADLSIFLEELGNVGSFIQNIINANSKTLVKFLVPGLERSITKKLNRKLNRIKIAD
ncbi:hypothetical protein FJT64_017388 [Amphibalanus amphitrite]|uniref:Protein takeout n=1 Tax=Amphibalanus amphitrite TaxID=1232801 RepID=A0A6A4X2W8_AMPAM|nr:hypothetical protein FJT64_017388 [Amphibalanus amphitrite]